MLTLPPEISKKFSTILIFGAPGSGKGTQGRFLSSAGNHYHLSSGDIFRGLAPDSLAGKRFYSYASQGRLVPDQLTVEIWYHFVMGLIATNRYFPEKQLLLLDGMPRTQQQAEILDSYLEVKTIILLKSKSNGFLVQRLKKRALIERRFDDSDEEVLKKRIELYEREIPPILAHYSKEQIVSFDAEMRPLEVLRDILISLCQLLS